MLLRFDQGELAILSSAVRTNTRHDAFVFGTDGSIHIENFWRATTAHLKTGHQQQSETCNFCSTGFEYEAREVARCVMENQIESPAMTHQMSVDVMAVMDEIRLELGLRYPFEDNLLETGR
ncbi:MAG TPA: hypothetical protein VGG06_24340 [Thermoanaerobaculia bacterium]|jgi:predicted dehydrogenase